MPRTRLYAPGAGSAQIVLSDEDTLGVRKTLRLQPGDCVACFNGDAIEYQYQIEESRRREIHLVKISSAPNPADNLPDAITFIAATKGKTKDRIARDLPPLGVTKIVFYRADRSICQPQLDAQPRLQKIAIEACRQCGRSTIPEIAIFDDSLPEVFSAEQIDPGQSLLFWERSSPAGDWRQNEYRQTAALIFGPEGGFSPEEIEWFLSKNIPIASLGRRILRAELAAVVGTAWMQIHRGIIF